MWQSKNIYTIVTHFVKHEWKCNKYPDRTSRFHSIYSLGNHPFWNVEYDVAKLSASKTKYTKYMSSKIMMWIHCVRFWKHLNSDAFFKHGIYHMNGPDRTSRLASSASHSRSCTVFWSAFASFFHRSASSISTWHRDQPRGEGGTLGTVTSNKSILKKTKPNRNSKPGETIYRWLQFWYQCRPQ